MSMFKKSAPVLLLGTLLLTVPLAATAQDNGKGGSKGGSTSLVPTVGGSGKVSVESLVQRYLPIAGSQTNGQSLVNGLRDGNEVSLSGTVQEQVRVPVQTQVTEAVQVPVQTQVTETVMVAVRKPAPPPAVPGTFITVMQPQTVTKTIMVPETVYETMTVPVTVYKPVNRTRTITVYRNVPQSREVNRTPLPTSVLRPL